MPQDVDRIEAARDWAFRADYAMRSTTGSLEIYLAVMPEDFSETNFLLLLSELGAGSVAGLEHFPPASVKDEFGADSGVHCAFPLAASGGAAALCNATAIFRQGRGVGVVLYVIHGRGGLDAMLAAFYALRFAD